MEKSYYFSLRRRLPARFRIKPLAAGLLLLTGLISVAPAQETFISQHVEVYGTTGNAAGDQSTVPTSGVYSVSVTAGQNVIGGSASSNYSTDLGIWSFYLKEPNAPIVDASDGAQAHPSFIKVGWSQDILSPKATGEIPAGSSFPANRWQVTRDNVFRANVSNDDPTLDDGQSIFPGQLYDYGVKVSNNFGVSAEGHDIGFTLPNGKIAGRVFTPGPTPGAPWTPTGNPVADVEVSLSPIRGKALLFDGIDDYLRIDSWYEELADTALTVEFWFNIDLSPAAATIFDMGDRLRISHDAANLTVSLGSTDFSTGLPTLQTWHHLAAAYGGGQLTVYLDGASVGAVECNDFPAGSDVRVGKRNNSIDYFDGLVDDLRIWNRARSLEQIVRNKDRAQFGSEAGLISYWKFDEGTGDYSFNMTSSKTNATLFGADWSGDIPAVKLSAFTDENGKYEIRGVWYDATTDAGTPYTVTPFKQNHNFFTPANDQVTVTRSVPEFSDVKFLDESMFTVSGILTYDGTSCPVVGAEILLDSASTRSGTFTGTEGEYSIDFEPDANGTLTVRFGGIMVDDTSTAESGDSLYAGGHVFELNGVEQGYNVLAINSDHAGVDFANIHTETLSGLIGGGECFYPVGNVEVTLRSTPACYEKKDTVATGEAFEIPFQPPLDYQLIVEHLSNSAITFQNSTISLEDSSKYIEMIYKSPPVARLSDFPWGDGCEVVYQQQSDSFKVEFFEPYGGYESVESNECPIDSFIIQAFDDISGIQTEPWPVLAPGGELYYHFQPLKPNIISGGSHPYQRRIQIFVSDPLGRNSTATVWAYVEGEVRTEGTDFLTVPARSNVLPFFVLRDPPGDLSYSYLTEEQTVTRTFSVMTEDEHNVNNWLNVSLGLDFTTNVGFTVPFVGTSVEWELEVDLTADINNSWGYSQNEVSTTETEVSFTTSETITTNGEGFVVGGDADIFVGGGLNMTYGRTLILDVDENCQVVLDTSNSLDLNGFHSFYTYSGYHIRNNLLKDLAENYRTAAPADTGRLGDAIRYWNRQLDLNEAAKASALATSASSPSTGESISNISFDALSSYEYSTTTDSSISNSTEITVSEWDEFGGEGGVLVNGVGLVGGRSTTDTENETTGEGSGESYSRTIGFFLGDDDPGDAFTVNVKRDSIWGMPVFELAAGQTSNPWEAGTFKRQWADLSVSPALQSDIEPGDPAVFELTLANLSETGETWAYNLSLLNETNPYGAVVSVNGVNLGGGGIDFEVDAGDGVTATLELQRGPVEYYYNDLEMNFAPPGELDIADVLGENPQNSAFATFSASFIAPCTEIDLSIPDENWLVNQFSGDTILVTMSGFDTSDIQLKTLLFEYSLEGEDQWFLGDSISIDSVRSLGQDFISLVWQVPADDGGYLLRARSECRLRDDLSGALAGIIDRRSPELLGVPQPADEILQAYDQIILTLDENIDCGSVGPTSARLFYALSGLNIACEISCSGDELIITPANSVSNREIENQRLKAEVYSLKDAAGNPMAVDTLAWEFVVDRNPVHWNTARHEQVVYTGEETVIPIELTNNGGAPGAFEFGNLLNLPDWVTPSPLYGQINPGGSLVIYLHIDPYLNIGTYEETIFAETPEGDEPLVLSLNVMCPPPAWDFYVPQFQYSMPVTASLAVQGDQSLDEYDMVGAFIGGQCRGFARLEHLVMEDDTGAVVLDNYMAFLTVYSDNPAGDTVTFRIWDNSRCHELWEVEQELEFSAMQSYGTPSSPLVLNATGAIAQEFQFNDGWTWFSLNLENDDMSFSAVTENLAASAGDRIIAETAYAQYSELGQWFGPLTAMEFDNESMYQADLDSAAGLPFVGFIADPELNPVFLDSGWNWVGYPVQVNLELETALTSLSAGQDDIIKSQYGFAQYDELFGWLGSLTWLSPGEGYMMRVSENDTLTYSGLAAAAPPQMLARLDGEDLPESPWDFEPAQYRNSMVLTALLESDTVGINNPGDVIVAMVEDEVRGIARPIYIPELEQYRIFLMVYGSNGETVKLKIWESQTEITYRGNEVFTFRSNDITGSPAKPVELTRASLQVGDFGYVPEEYSLGQNFPNPFNPITRMGFGIPEDSRVTIRIFDLLGRHVRTLVDDRMEAGYRFVVWNSTNDSGQQVTSGVYFVVMESEGFREVKKMVLLK